MKIILFFSAMRFIIGNASVQNTSKKISYGILHTAYYPLQMNFIAKAVK